MENQFFFSLFFIVFISHLHAAQKSNHQVKTDRTANISILNNDTQPGIAHSPSSEESTSSASSELNTNRTGMYQYTNQFVANHQQNQTDDLSQYGLNPNTTPINNTLMKSVLDNCPQAVKNIVNDLLETEDIDTVFPRKLLLVGPPGTGKTTIGKAIAARTGIPFMMFKAGAIANEYKSSGTKNLERIFTAISHKNNTYIIIFDELESLIKQHQNNYDTESCMLVILWQLLDDYSNLRILFIGTLNDASGAPAPLRNRFGENIVDVPLPSKMEREKLILYHMGLYPRIPMNIDSKYVFRIPFFQYEKLYVVLAQSTDGFSPRALERFMLNAYKIARRQQRNNQKFDVEDCFWEAFEDAYKAKVSEDKIRDKEIWDKKIKEFIEKWGAVGQVVATASNLTAIVTGICGIRQQWRTAEIQELSVPLTDLQRRDLENRQNGHGWARENMLPWAQAGLSIMPLLVGGAKATKKIIAIFFPPLTPPTV